MSRLPMLSLLGALVTGCGASHSHVALEDRALTEAPPPPQPAPASRPPPEDPPPSPQDARAFLARYPTAAACEGAARRLQASSRDDAWLALKLCADQPTFTQLGAVLGSAWAEDLRVRPDAAPLIARVVAQRGGSVDGELRLLHARKVPIFSLASAIAQPDTYRGRYVLLRAQVADQRLDGERPTLWLVEQGLQSVGSHRDVGVTYRTDTLSETSGDLGGRTVLTGEGRVGGSLVTRESTGQSATVRTYDNISEETGREALGRLPAPDPFLESRRDYVILARFDGLRVTSGMTTDDEDEGPRIPVLTIVSYHLPQALAVY
ncbi:hypothetical protein D7V97_09220 [Corallococcus sp. CA053C]|uniref:hypothetical protein n=1 Tax=Corallococcus sp. CA053C TaxID=2316732 RepID=UPI000EA240ED|nr:hypothetical protein [Corallococcus sp. CA053C]RKH12206.1 hypothetical protein D7V97_09220 [Corallococcus sp. CA053C]